MEFLGFILTFLVGFGLGAFCLTKFPDRIKPLLEAIENLFKKKKSNNDE